MTALVVLTVDGDRLVRAERHEGGALEPLVGLAGDATGALADAARHHRDALIAWCDVALAPTRPPVDQWPARLRHPRELRHVGFLHRNDPAWASLGAVDYASPLVLPAPPDREFATWLVSPLAGITSAEVLDAVGPTASGLPFATATLLLGHRALRAGIMVWSDPALVDGAAGDAPRVAWSDVALAVRHIAGSKFLGPWAAVGGGGARAWRDAARAAVDRHPVAPAGPPPPLPGAETGAATVDVVMASLDRRPLLVQVLADLADQTHPVRRVVVVEQVLAGMDDPGPLDAGDVPYELIHRRIDRQGAVHARNLALQECDADWVLFVDDDVRLGVTAVERLVATGIDLGAEAVTARVWTVPEGDPVDVTTPPDGPDWPVMWTSFNTGAALASRRLVEEVGGFDDRLEGGFGEDHEWGVRARAAGAMVAYAPEVGVPHLKHRSGGLRREHPHPWREAGDEPVPSPTVLVSRRLYQTDPMYRGWRLHYWLGRVRDGAWRHPVTANRSWRAAHRWADHLERQTTS